MSRGMGRSVTGPRQISPLLFWKEQKMSKTVTPTESPAPEPQPEHLPPETWRPDVNRPLTSNEFACLLDDIEVAEIFGPEIETAGLDEIDLLIAEFFTRAAISEVTQ
ncbi:MAG: hypothetical protein AB7S77_24490 [Desulfatirhabdiaceae bacterium]